MVDGRESVARVSEGAPLEIHVIADSTGDTAARMARAARTQFAQHPARITRHPRVMDRGGVDRAFDRIAKSSGAGVVVFSTLVDDDLRRYAERESRSRSLPYCDLLGPALAVIEQASGDRSEGVPARPVGIESNYFDRIAAMEYVIKHDDGQHVAGITDADIVLVGVSRTGKTPLSMYLGYLGYRTANVPLVTGISPPVQLFDIDRFRIVSLTIDPQRLLAIRQKRMTAIARDRADSAYADLAAILTDIEHADSVRRRLGCPVIDTTSVAMEEAAGRVIDLVEERRPSHIRWPRVRRSDPDRSP